MQRALGQKRQKEAKPCVWCSNVGLILNGVVIVTAADLTFNQGVRVRLPPTSLLEYRVLSIWSDARLDKGAVCNTVVFGLSRFDSYSDRFRKAGKRSIRQLRELDSVGSNPTLPIRSLLKPTTGVVPGVQTAGMKSAARSAGAFGTGEV